MSPEGNGYAGSCSTMSDDISISSGYLNSRDQVSLELVQVHVERAVEAKRSCDGRNDLCDEPVEVGEAWRRNVKVLLADVVNGFVVNLTKSQHGCNGAKRYALP